MDSGENSAARRRATSGTSRFLSNYYIANALIILSFALVHRWFEEHSDMKYSRLVDRRDLGARERQASTLLLISLTLKFFRRQSLDAFFSDAFSLSKGVIALLTFYMDTRVFVYYLIMYLMVALMFPQPTYKGPSRMEDFTPASFAEIVEDRSNSPVSWLVEFYAPWAPQCLYLEPVLAEISLQYSSETLRFGKIDVSRWPALAKRYKISIRGENGNQLPTLIMFENGKGSGRIPHVYNDGKVAAGKYRKNDIVTAFALGEKQAGNKGGSSKKKGGGGSGSAAGKKKN